MVCELAILRSIGRCADGESQCGATVLAQDDTVNLLWGTGGVIVGTGTDIVEIERVQRSVERFGKAFLDRVFTPGEIAYCNARNKGAAESFAARFAAKEAAAKALGTGIARGVGWKEIEVVRHPGERPNIRFSGRAGQHASRLGVTAAHLSLTHDRTSAMAMVILEGVSEGREDVPLIGGESAG